MQFQTLKKMQLPPILDGATIRGITTIRYILITKDLNFEEINQQYIKNEAERLLAVKETTRKKKAK